ncbi:hypothetical protein RN001_000515 [Aquatica leii]|uniref:N-alpha-acetyltransferase 40 n=1 Tax=Aquatica leii TaxID=1421715 RepID=A0AAN7PF09_9COLE|nr:hypothetical protein RN001_000515 [Aquatica leii]
MGKKVNPTGKEKRQKRKDEQHRLKLAMQMVEKANALTDPLEPFPAFKVFKKDDLHVMLYVKRLADLEDNVKEWIFNLTKQNMEEMYNNCSWGWNDKKKQEELMDESAWYLIAKLVDGKLLGFSHFRFDIDEGIEVLYCYELQLEVDVQRKGLGKFMMQILELMAFMNNMKKVVLTVLKNNDNSHFFKAINYQIDDSSPIDEDDDDEEYPYEILSKINKKLLSG